MTTDDLVNLAEQRVKQMEQIVVPHPALVGAHRGMDTLVAHARCNPDGEKKCMALIAPSASGKSTIIRDYVSKKNRPDLLAQGKVPALHVTLKPSPSKKSMPKDILYKIAELTGRETNPELGSETNLLERVRVFLKQAETEILFIDEFHHVLRSDSKKIATAVGDIVKWMLITCSCPIVVSGTEEAAQPFRENWQLVRRSIPGVNLGALKMNEVEDRELFKRFLGHLLSETENRGIAQNAKALIRGEAPAKLMEAAGGIFGAAANILYTAVRIMTLDKRDVIIGEDLASACDQMVLADICRTNPFRSGARGMDVSG